MPATTRAPVIAVTHGGGPLPLMNEPSQATIAESLRTKVPPLLGLPQNLQIGLTSQGNSSSNVATSPKPRAIVLVSAHWETDVVTVCTGKQHKLLFDYYGFPDEAYHYKYDAPGSPEVAGQVMALLEGAGIKVEGDDKRGWDHALFVPMLLIAPSASIPIVQISVPASQSPTSLFRLGQALAPIRYSSNDTAPVAILASGSPSLHNLPLMFNPRKLTSASFQSTYKEWEAKLDDAAKTRSEKERQKKFEGWKSWEGATIMHPPGRAEHLSPLIVAAGAAGEVEEGAVWGWEDESNYVAMGNWVWT